MEVKIETSSPMRALGLRHVGPYHQIGETFGRLMQISETLGISNSNCIAIYYDDPSMVPPNHLKSDACIVVHGEFDSDIGELHWVEIPSRKYAIGRYVGSYAGLGDAWHWMFGEGMAQFKQMPAKGITFESYVHVDHGNPDACITDIYVPIA